jgi:hypothetical protein
VRILFLRKAERQHHWCFPFAVDGNPEPTIQWLYNGKELNHPFGISHHRDSIFWTEYMNASVFQLDLASGDVTLLRSERPPLFGLRVYDAPSQQGPGADASFSRSDVFVSLFLCFSFLCACLWLSFHLRTFVSLFIYSMMC